jgi:hypothetical protein
MVGINADAAYLQCVVTHFRMTGLTVMN